MPVRRLPFALVKDLRWYWLKQWLCWNLKNDSACIAERLVLKTEVNRHPLLWMNVEDWSFYLMILESTTRCDLSRKEFLTLSFPLLIIFLSIEHTMKCNLKEFAHLVKRFLYHSLKETIDPASRCLTNESRIETCSEWNDLYCLSY
jgi:hypothetical protein